MHSRPQPRRQLKVSINTLARLLVLCVLATWHPTVTYASTQLIMLEEAGCVYCAKFNHEIAEIYPKTAEGKLAPLRRIDLHEQWPEDLKAVTPDTVTPTFILVNNAREVGRLRGYRGDEFFWALLNELLMKINADGTH